MVYGEQDSNFMTSVLGVAHKFGGRVPKIAGAGGKQQVVYAGNIIIHICTV